MSVEVKTKLVPDAVIKRLVAAYRPDRIYLFGSQARGDADSDSDFDILILIPDDADEERKSSGRAIDALRGLDFPAEVHVMTAGYFDRRTHLKASLPGAVMREGMSIYDARSGAD